MPKLVLLDTNLLILFIVGGANRDYIARHKNSLQFNKQDFDDLIFHINASAGIITTSQILSETSNMIRQVGDPMKTELTAFFKVFVDYTRELQPLSNVATQDESYLWLGLNDASILGCLDDDRVLITEDNNLFATAVTRRPEGALHFSALKSPGV